MTNLITGFTHHTITQTGIITNTKTGNIKAHWKGANGYLHVDIQEYGRSKKISLHRLLAIQYIPNPSNKRTVNHIDGNKLNNLLNNLEWATDTENQQHAWDTSLQPYRRLHTLDEYTILLYQFLANHVSITKLAEQSKNSLTQLSLHLRESAIANNALAEYELELLSQKAARAKQAGISKRKNIILHMLDKTTGEILNTFSSITEATKYLKRKSCGPISNVLAGRQKTAYGYRWKTS